MPDVFTVFLNKDGDDDDDEGHQIPKCITKILYALINNNSSSNISFSNVTFPWSLVNKLN